MLARPRLNPAKRQPVERQDLTRIANIDGADVRGFAPRAVTPPTARRVSHLSLFNDLGTQSLSRSFISQSWLVASGNVTGEERSGGSEGSCCIRSPFVCGAGPLRAGIYDEGCFGCVGIGRISRIASEIPDRGSATSRDLLFNGLGQFLRPEVVEQRKERP